MEHWLTHPSRCVVQKGCQVRIERNRSRCGVATPESSAHAPRTPPNPPPAIAAGAGTEIGLICRVPMKHIEFPFCARATSHQCCLLGTTARSRKQVTQYDLKIARVVCRLREFRRQARCHACMSWNKTEHCVPERNIPKHGTRPAERPGPVSESICSAISSGQLSSSMSSEE